MTDVHPSGPDLGLYALGALTPAEAAALDEHLQTCSTCPQEVAALTETVGSLGEVPPEFFLDGPPEDDLLLQRTLRQTRAETAAPGTARRRTLLVAAAAAAGVVLLGGGVLAGRQLAPVSAPTPGPTTATPTPVPGTRTASATDASTGASLAVVIVPAAGWVRVSATARGIPAGEKCRLVVAGRGGQREIAGSWLVSPKAAQDGTALTGFALVDPAQVSAVTVETTAGKRFVSVPIT